MPPMFKKRARRAPAGDAKNPLDRAALDAIDVRPEETDDSSLTTTTKTIINNNNNNNNNNTLQSLGIVSSQEDSAAKIRALSAQALLKESLSSRDAALTDASGAKTSDKSSGKRGFVHGNGSGKGADKRRALVNAQGQRLYVGASGGPRLLGGASGDLKAAMGIKAGVQLSASNVSMRARTQVDHQGGVCKDYKETGYCGYGDNCIYVHDRETHKAGWELERDWELERRGRLLGDVSRLGNGGDDRESAAEKQWFECPKCGLEFRKPVRASCGHCFCEDCALETTECVVCAARTNGTYTTAFDLEKRLRERAEKIKGGNEKEGSLGGVAVP